MCRLLFFISLLALATASKAAQSTFDVDNEGWRTCNVDFSLGTATADDFMPAIYTADNGSPAGSLVTGDVSRWTFYAAPAAFLGDRTADLGGELSFDTYALQNDALSYPGVVVTSGAVAVYAVLPPPQTDWSPSVVSLTGAAWSLSPEAGGSLLTDAALAAVMANVDGLYIQADWYFGDDTVGLDNVRLGPVPEPASLLALAFGAGALARRRRRLVRASQ